MLRARLVISLSMIGCGSIVPVGESGDSSGDATDESTSVTTTTASTTLGTTDPSTTVGTTVATTSSTTDPTTASDVTTDGPPEQLACQPSCDTINDCCVTYTGSDDCNGMLGTYPWNLSCDANICQFGPCTSDEDCTYGGLIEGYVCRPSGDTHVCQVACEQASDCADLGLSGYLCSPSGVCELPTCDSDADCTDGTICSPQLGVCIAPCTDRGCAGFGHCDPDTRNCQCDDGDMCPSGFVCAPYD